MKIVNGFKLWDKKPNTVDKRGHLFHRDLYFDTKNKSKNRKIRLYLPSSYDFDNPNKRFKVMYMLDGKNLFDDYTSFVGEWQIDEIVESFIEQKLIDGLIVVGIDAPKSGKDRTMEMTAPNLIFRKATKYQGKVEQGYANVLGDFIFKEVKPLIDKSFHTLPEKENTFIGGSSMGGMMAFYLAIFYKEYLGGALCYSPAFFLYKWQNFFSNILKDIVHDGSYPKFDLYVGGKGFESLFVDTTFKTYEYLKSLGYQEDELRLVYQKEEEHNEQAWRKYVPDSFKFLLK